MIERNLLLAIFMPLISGVAVFFIPRRFSRAIAVFSLLVLFSNLHTAAKLFRENAGFTLPWAGLGMDFSLRIYQFSAFMLLAIAAFGLLIILYSCAAMRGRPCLKQFYAYVLLTIAAANGVVLADNLAVMVFFWEGLLLTLFGMINIGNKSAFKTATKAFIIVGITDLCLMLGVILAGYLAGTLTISKIVLPATGLGALAFVLLMIGAISKAGAMPFHSWIPDAAVDAPLPVMAILAGALDKILGIYFLARICLDIFKLTPGSGMSMLLMVVGAVTLLFAVMMALIQKDYKKLLSYHAISQVGYMILGIGTAVPAGIVGGLFHMVNNALYKSGLFLTAGSVEKQAGTTDLSKLGGIAGKMPVTFACFLICALSISGVPPFNGFFSKELVYDGALERGLIFYLAAVIGSFFTAASFLKLGHAAYLGKRAQAHDQVKEAPIAMLIPMLVISGICVWFGINNALPIKQLIQPVLGGHVEHELAGFPANLTLVVITLVVLAAAVLNHLYGVKKQGSGIRAVDHIHYAPILSGIYARAEKKVFDPYEVGWKVTGIFSLILWAIDKTIDWVYNVLIVGITNAFSRLVRGLQSGGYPAYLTWSFMGMFLVVMFLLGGKIK